MTALLEDGTHGTEDVLASELLLDVEVEVLERKLLIDVEFDRLDCTLFTEEELDAELKTSTQLGQRLFLEEVRIVEEF